MMPGLDTLWACQYKRLLFPAANFEVRELMVGGGFKLDPVATLRAALVSMNAENADGSALPSAHGREWQQVILQPLRPESALHHPPHSHSCADADRLLPNPQLLCGIPRCGLSARADG
jgi:hypothetical protein